MRLPPLLTRPVSRLLNRYCKGLSNDISLTLLYLLRTHFDLPSHGRDISVDRTIYAAVIAYLKPSHSQSQAGDGFEAYFTWLRTNDSCSTLRELFLRIQHRISLTADERTAIEEVYCSLYESNISFLSPAHIWKTRTTVKTMLREAKGEWLDKRYRKLHFNIRAVAAYVPVASFLLICSGYIHTSIVYKHFNIDPTYFFSIGDYLATSLQQIEHAVLPCISYAIGSVLAYVRQPTMPRIRDRSEIRKDELVLNTMFVLSLAMLVTMGLMWERLATSSTSAGLVGFFMLFAMLRLESLIPLRFLQNQVRGRLLLIAVAMFFGIIVASSYVKINVVTNGLSDEKFVLVAGEQTLTDEEYSIIGSNSSYVFIWSKDERVQIIPWNNIEEMEISVE